MRAAARRLLQNRSLRPKLQRWEYELLTKIGDGTRKRLDSMQVGWWKKKHGDVDQAKLAKLAALADPARNSNAHERANAEAKLKTFKGRRAPGMPPAPPPLPDFLQPSAAYMRSMRRNAKSPPTSPKKEHARTASGDLEQINWLMGRIRELESKTEPKPKAGVKQAGVKQKPTAATGRNRDRHKPGYMRDYMRDYMRERRAKAKAKPKAKS